MKKTFLLVSFVLILIFVGGCESNSMSNHTTKLVVYGFHQPYLFTVTNSEDIKVSTGPMNFDFEKLEFTGEVESSENLKLSAKDKLDITKLVEDVIASTSENSKNQSYMDVDEVAALINGKMYHSIYVTDTEKTSIESRYLNRELLNLTYKLIELSPIKVGGDQNPIIIPKQ
ncbi:MAG: hypothetical protein J6J62_07620 [Oscillospiraceae bacterium]|nr:hypothetical protein [Oscillospiraceae bacterium]